MRGANNSIASAQSLMIALLGQELRPPVRIVVFDCLSLGQRLLLFWAVKSLEGDETLTLSTFLPDDVQLRTQLDWTSPWGPDVSLMALLMTMTSAEKTCLSVTISMRGHGKVGGLHRHSELRVSFRKFRCLGTYVLGFP